MPFNISLQYNSINVIKLFPLSAYKFVIESTGIVTLDMASRNNFITI